MKLDRQSFTITTEQLILIPLSLDHADVMLKECIKDAKQKTHLIVPRTLGEVHSYIEASIDGFAQKQGVVVAVLHKETREYLGYAAVQSLSLTSPTLFISLNKNILENEYEKEIIKGIKAWGDKHLLYTHFIYQVRDENLESKQVAESLGAVLKNEHVNLSQNGEEYKLSDYFFYKEVR